LSNNESRLIANNQPQLITNPAIGGEKRWQLTVAIAMIGWALAIMDQSFFTFAYPHMQEEFNITLTQVSHLYLVIYLVGWAATLAIGPVVDYWGRRTAFQLTMLVTAIGSLLTAFSSGFGSLLGYRCLSSAGSCSENFTSHVMVIESVPPQKKGMMVALAQCGYPIGWFLAAGLSLVFMNSLGWRSLFIIGVAPALFVVFLRLFTKEPERFKAVKQIREMGKEVNAESLSSKVVDVNKLGHGVFRQLFEQDLFRTTVSMSIYMAMVSLCTAVAMLWAPTIAESRNISQETLQTVMMIGTALAVPGYLSAGYLGTRIGRKYASMIYVLVGIIFGVLMAVFGKTVTSYSVFFALWMFFSLGAYGSNMTLIMESFPTRVRGTGANFVGQFVWIGDALASIIGPLFLSAFGTTGSLIAWLGLIPALGVVALCFTRNIPPNVELEEIAI
jgi:putative MFS transporter